MRNLLKKKVIIFDGATGTYLQTFGLKPEDYGSLKYEGLNEYLSISKPEAVSRVHEDYLKSGADVIETNTFGANSAALAEYGLADKVKELNSAAVKLARAACAKYSTPDKPRLVAGSIGPTNKSIFVTGGVSFDQMRSLYLEQVNALLHAGVDILLFETAHDIINLKAGLAAARQAFGGGTGGVPVIASVTMDSLGSMLTGHNAEAVYSALSHFPLSALGFNCGTGPKNMGTRLEALSKVSPFPIFCMPNAGLPDENGRYTQTPENFAALMCEFAKKGWLNIAGGCCGTLPGHIKALSAALNGVKPGARRGDRPWTLSGVEALYYEDMEPPVMAGERNNSIGSKKFRDIAAAGRWDEAVEMARTQVKAGAHVLDVCLSNPERSELEDIKTFIPMLVKAVRVPLMIDTTDIKAMEEVLKYAPGKIILNSVNFEFGEDKPRQAAELCKTYGAKLVFGCIDENKQEGMARTAERKTAIAERAYKFLTGVCGLPEEDIIFDPLVFPVGVGPEYAATAEETIKAVAEIGKRFPKTKTALGVSNVSFGLPPAGREILNSVFLHHLARAGLGVAIVNIGKLKRYSSMAQNEKALAEDLIFARKADAASAFAEYFRDVKKTVLTEDKTSAMPPEEALAAKINDGSKDGVEEIVNKLLLKYGPLEIINGPVLKAMGEVGRKFAAGELIVTEVLQSAEVTKKAVAVMEGALKAAKAPKRGKLLLATVKGDVHDIGKNLVNIIFESNGFEVVDLGVKVSSETIVEAALKEKPDFIGLSGLLVRSTEQMAVTARELSSAGVSCPLLAGGAALTLKYTENNIAPVYKGKVFYAQDAMSGLNYALEIGVKSLELGKKAHDVRGSRMENESSCGQLNSKLPTPNFGYYPADIPVPADLERHFTGEQALEELFENLDEGLFNLRFLKLNKARPEKAAEAARLLAAMKKEVIGSRLIKARGVYQFFPVNSSGDDLLFYDKAGTRMASFAFPRRTAGDRLCLADFAAPVSGGVKDYAALFAVTCGEGVLAYAKREREAGNYVKSYMAEALALTLAEAFAEVMHYRLRQAWGIAGAGPVRPPLRSKYRGKRYSFGCPACPDLANQKILFDLLKPEADAGLRLTEGFMMDPEASVSAIVFHNPKAVYFSV
ncbi:MAG: methionine synthase [Elusimicrobia bacterium GWC2_51_8]|nr:MAG: methionine synthase [Elusimicrobia bacterium GWA2_51_34]OGR62517.1 MAG: methionine synthase [Elusimicrobia bacterium GWC2_51_8]HAF96231.1 methionine synthase [Elusimicrobiota bacterium]HCE97841.1 methionine synthase [Elusimicrobiota bacterium]